MNRFQFLGSQTDEAGQEWCYVLDTQTGSTLKSPVQPFGGASAPVVMKGGANIFPKDTVTAPGAVKKDHDPRGEIETAEERELRLKGNKVPPAFLGDIRRMHMDPSKTDGRTDVTPAH